MKRFLDKFRDVPRGSKLRDIVTLEWVTAVQDLLKALAAGENITTSGLTRQPGDGKVRLTARSRFIPWGKGSSTVKSDCPFGEIIKYNVEESDSDEGSDSSPETKTGIRGGNLKAGKKTWRVPHRPVNLVLEGEWLIYIRIKITANTNPTNIATLSGVKTSERPEWKNIVYDSSDSDPASYEDEKIPDMFPTATPGDGTAIVPIGILKIKDGKATLQPTGCGDITITHCPGVLGSFRGGVADSSLQN